MITFICPICRRAYDGDKAVIVVTPDRRKHRRGRIAWTRDGICLACAEKIKKGEHRE